MTTLTNCRECGAPVSRAADPWPSCGARHPALGAGGKVFLNIVSAVFGIIVGIPLLFLFVSCSVALLS